MFANPLLDKAFLKELDAVNERTIYAKVIALDWSENPIAEIQGMVTTGTINIDGSSIVRRTCNITMVANTIDIQNIDWVLRTKIKVFIGMQNNITQEYDKIIWFPQGIFVLTSFSNTYNSSGYTINIQGRDKMCLLNGDLGGNLFATHDFGTVYTFDNEGNYKKDDIPIKTIIKEAVHTYAQEPYENIFINDLDTCGVELIEWRGDSTVFVTQTLNENSNVYSLDYYITTSQENAILENSATDLDAIVAADQSNTLQGLFYEWVWRHRTEEPASIKAICNGRITLPSNYPDTDIIKRAVYGETIGYRATDLTYAGDLIVDLNGTITQMLDKIVEMLGEFEYFYDTEGRFIFQRKKIYFNSSWSNAVVNDASDEKYYDATATASQYSYEFKSHYLIESIQNKPEVKNIKNDFGIWGKRTSASGETLDIHMRYAIDKKPRTYYSRKYRKAFNSEQPVNQLVLEIQAAKANQEISADASAETIQRWLSTHRGINAQLDEIEVAKQADVSGYDWRQLIYFMAEDNALANNRIGALKKCLQYGLYQYDPSLVEKYMYDRTYYYNGITDRFYPMTYDTTGGEDTTSPAVRGYNRLVTYLVNGNAIYGKDPSYSYYDFTDDEWTINRAMAQQAVDAYNAIVQRKIYGDGYEEADGAETSITACSNKYLNEYYTTYSSMQNSYLWDTQSPIYQQYATDEERWDAYNEAWEAKRQQYINDMNNNPKYMRQYNRIEAMYYQQLHPNSGTYSSKPYLTNANNQKYVYSEPGEFYQVWRALAQAETKTINQWLNESEETQGLLSAKARRLMTKEIELWQSTFNTGYDAYYADILAFWPLMYKISQDHDYEYNTDGTLTFDEEGNPIERQHITYVLDQGVYKEVRKQKMTLREFNEWRRNGFWNPETFLYNFTYHQVTITNPQELIFWLDFVDYRGELLPYLPELIGRRAKVLKDDKIKAIYYRETPDILFIDQSLAPDEQVEGYEELAFSHVNVAPYLNTYLYISSQGKSAKEELDNLLYQHTFYKDVITLNTIPIYYLEPNTLILVQDEGTGINGDYMIKSMSISLAHDGMMSITANRAGQRVF